MLEPSEEDFMEALKEMQTYVDITPEDLKKIYTLAIKHARTRLLGPKAEDIMTAKVVCVTPETKIEEAIDLLAEHHISGMPVIIENKVIGVITEADIISAITGKQKPKLLDLLHKRTGKIPTLVKDVMTTPAITVVSSTPVYKIAELFKNRNINRVPVMDEQNTLLGIVTRADVVKAYEKVKG